MDDYPGFSFRIEVTSGGVLATFTQASNGDEEVSEGVNSLLAYIVKYPGQRVPEFSMQLHVPAKTIERWLKQLREENRVVFKGPPKTGGYFCVEK